MTLFTALLTATVALAGGWRGDGTGVYASATLPTDLTTLPPTVWQVELPGWSNATPVLAGGLVCTNVEPTTLSCHDARTGARRWSQTNDYADTLDPAGKAAHAQRLAAMKADEAAFEATRREVSDLRRQLRYGDAAAITAQLEAATPRLEALRQRIDAVKPYLTPPDKEVIGYSSPTPTTDGTTLWALYGNGVLSAFNVADGRRLWSRWLGASGVDMRGYHIGVSASPQLIAGTLVVPYGKLRGLDPKTGAERWTGVPYTDFGTPTAARVGAADVVVLATGEIVRVADGAVLASGLGDLMYKGPHVQGDRVWYMGGVSESLNRQRGGIVASSWRLKPEGDRGVRAEKVWEFRLPTTEPFYAQPIVWEGKLYAMDRNAALWVIDAETGTVLSKATLFTGQGDVYSPLQVAAGVLVSGSENGRLAFITPGATPKVAASWVTEPFRTAVVFDGGAIYHRTLHHLTRYAR